MFLISVNDYDNIGLRGDKMFGEQLKKARLHKGYTLEQLADIYNVRFDGKLSKGTLSKYENNKQEPMISVVNNLSSILEVSTDFLLAKENSTIDSNYIRIDSHGLVEEKLKDLIIEKYNSVKSFALSIGIPYTTLDSILKRGIDKANVLNIIKICNALGIDVDELSNGQIKPKLKGQDSPSPDAIDVTKLKNYVPYHPVKVPFLGEIACGEPIYANQEYDSYVITDEGIHADFCIRAKGDSMVNAGIDEGDIVFIHRQSYIDNGSIAAVAIDDTVTLKRFYQSDTTVTLVAENPAYAPIIYNFSDGKSIYILGKAVAVQKPLAPAGKAKNTKEEYVTLPVAARSKKGPSESAEPHKLTRRQWEEAQEA